MAYSHQRRESRISAHIFDTAHQCPLPPHLTCYYDGILLQLVFRAGRVGCKRFRELASAGTANVTGLTAKAHFSSVSVLTSRGLSDAVGTDGGVVAMSWPPFACGGSFERRVDQNKRMQLNPGATLACCQLNSPALLRALADPLLEDAGG